MADYIIEPLDTDSEAIFQEFVEFMQTYIPTWEPREPQLDVIIARFFAMKVAFTADMASRVQRAIFRYLGSSLMNIPPLPGSRATATINFTLLPPPSGDDPVDHTLTIGTLVGMIDVDGDLQLFELINDLFVPAGESSAAGTVQALEEGEVYNGLTGSVSLIELVDWLESAAVVGASSGGADPEDDALYIPRLTENLALMAPRPIIAQDFSIMARNVPGVWRAAVIDNFGGGENEIQSLDHDYTDGDFRLTFGGLQTAPIAWNASASDIKTALGLLNNIDESDMDVTGGPVNSTPVEIEFIGKYLYTPLPLMSVNDTNLTGGTVFNNTVVNEGVAYNTTTENAIAISAIDSSGEPLSSDTKTELVNYLKGFRSQNFVINFIDPAYNPVSVTVEGRVTPGSEPASVDTTMDLRFQSYLSPANFGRIGHPTSLNREWVKDDTMRYLELTTIAEGTPGYDITDSLVFGVNGSSHDDLDKPLIGIFPLTRPGTIAITLAAA